jgi:hypothetical protein
MDAWAFPHEVFYCFSSSKNVINLGLQRPGAIAHVEFYRRGWYFDGFLTVHHSIDLN